MTIHLPFDTTYLGLPERFYAARALTPVAAPRLLKLNTALAEALGLDPAQLAGPDGIQVLAGNAAPDGATPIAMAYAGHQFGGFSPQLGDGRAVLLGEIIDRAGHRRDIQLKGAGPTRFSRAGDGRAGIGPVLREYLVSEAMAALGIPTTRALAAVATGETIFRDTALPGAVLTRVGASHIRVGTFEYFAARGDADGVRTLADYAIRRHYPEAADAANPYLALLGGVIDRQARLVAQWLLVGFIHGVMNTDNTSISGETIDYGPCAFMDAYDPATVFSSIDRTGRYAYGNQPRIMHWNLARLAEALLGLLAPTEAAAIEAAKDALGGFGPAFQSAYRSGLARKLGLQDDGDADQTLAQELLDAMAEAGADFTATFRSLADATDAPLFVHGPLAAWEPGWRRRLAETPAPPAGRRAAMRAVNPVYIPRNHHVEAALAAAAEGDLAPFDRLFGLLQHPFDEQPGHAAYAGPPDAPVPDYRTFCGT